MHAKSSLAGIAMAACVTGLFAAEPTASGTAYHLFSGSDIAVQVNGEYRPIVAADDGTFSIRTDKKVETVPLRKVSDVRVSQRLKLTNLSADVASIAGVQSSDAARRAQFQAMSDSEGTAAASSVDRDRGYAEFTRAGEVAEYARINARAPQGEDAEKFREKLANQVSQEGNRQLQAGLASSANQLNQSTAMLHMAVTAAPNSGDEVTITPQLSGSGGASVQVDSKTPVAAAPTIGTARVVIPKHLVDEGGGNSDRLDVTVQVSAPQPLENAYAVLITDFTLPRKGAGNFRRVVGKKIGSLDAKPRKVTIEAANFPPGFIVTKYDVLVFANGQQIATNLLENSATLSEDDAYQYILAQYVEANKGKTRPPAAMLMAPKSALKFDLTDVALQQPIYVTVDPKGAVTSIASDAAGAKDASASAKAALAHFRFLPALENGTQTGGRAKLVVADFVK